MSYRTSPNVVFFGTGLEYDFNNLCFKTVKFWCFKNGYQTRYHSENLNLKKNAERLRFNLMGVDDNISNFGNQGNDVSDSHALRC